MAPNDAYMTAVMTDMAVAVGDTEKAVAWTDFGMRNYPANKGHYSYLQGWALATGRRYQELAEVMKATGDWFALIPLIKAINAVHVGTPEEATAHVRRRLLNLTRPGLAKSGKTVNFADDKVLDRQARDLVKAA